MAGNAGKFGDISKGCQTLGNHDPRPASRISLSPVSNAPVLIATLGNPPRPNINIEEDFRAWR